jgi:predicted permease
MRRNVKGIGHFIAFVLILVGILSCYILTVWEGVEPQREKVPITATTIQNTISTGITAVSILLPLTVGILGFTAHKQKGKQAERLFQASVFFIISLLVALFNLYRLPGLVNIYNLANDKATGLLQIIQLFSLFYGVLYMVLGARGILKESSLDDQSK